MVIVAFRRPGSTLSRPGERRDPATGACCLKKVAVRWAAAYGSRHSPGRRNQSTLIDRPDQVLDLLRMWAELLGELVEQGIRERGKTLLVHILDDLDAKPLQLGGRGLF